MINKVNKMDSLIIDKIIGYLSVPELIKFRNISSLWNHVIKKKIYWYPSNNFTINPEKEEFNVFEIPNGRIKIGDVGHFVYERAQRGFNNFVVVDIKCDFLVVIKPFVYFENDKLILGIDSNNILKNIPFLDKKHEKGRGCYSGTDDGCQCGLEHTQDEWIKNKYYEMKGNKSKIYRKYYISSYNFSWFKTCVIGIVGWPEPYSNDELRHYRPYYQYCLYL